MVSKIKVDKTKNENPKEVSTVLEEVISHVGGMGLYQVLMFISMMPFGFVWAFVYFGQMFLTPTPQEHWCRIPELHELGIELRRNLSIPGALQGDYDRCMMYDANWTEVLENLLPPDPSTPIVSCRHGWEFLLVDIPYPTVVSEREWVCDRAYLAPFSQAINFLGSIVGGFLCGYLADKFGRLPVLVLANLLGVLGGFTTIFTNGFWDFSICRFIVGMSCDSCFILIYILVLEYVGIRHRTWVANMSISLYFGGGSLLLPWLALWISDWRNLVLATSLPMLVVVFMPFILPESARWLISKGKIDKAVNVLLRFERINRAKIPKEVFDDFIETVKVTKEDQKGLRYLFRIPSLRVILLVLILSFMSVAVVFDGLIRMSENLGLNFFITFTITSATEVPSIVLLVLLLDKFGRRRLVFVPMMIAALLSFIVAFIQRGIASVVIAVAARFFTSMAYNTVIQWTLELMPTFVRASSSAFVHISAYAAVMLSPFIVFSERVWDGLPLVIIAVVAFSGGAFALLLPETTGRPMPQTMENWEELVKIKSLNLKSKDCRSPEVIEDTVS